MKHNEVNGQKVTLIGFEGKWSKAYIGPMVQMINFDNDILTFGFGKRVMEELSS